MKKCIYTAIFKDYDDLKEPVIVTPGWDYICFTDNKKLKSDIWKIIYIPFEDKIFRKIKILYNEYVGDYDLTIWCDGSAQIRCNLDKFIEKYHKGNISIMRHPQRKCLYHEAQIIKAMGRFGNDIINKQIERYKKEGMPKNYGLIGSGILIRNKGLDMSIWWNEIKNYCIRDQLSFDYMRWKTGLKVNYFGEYFKIIKNEFKVMLHKRYDYLKEEVRFEQLKKCIPDILDYKTLLYIGITPQRNQTIKYFLEKNYFIDVVEAFDKNIEYLKTLDWYNELIEGDIMKVELSKQYDIIMFWHGIEHLTKEQLPILIKKLKKHTNKIIFACPFGINKQGASYENSFEVHKTHWYPEDLQKFGLKTDTIGEKDTTFCNLISWYEN